MRRFTTFLCATLALVMIATGCASKNAGKIEGTRWKSDGINMYGKDLPAGAITFDFKKDGTFKGSLSGRSVTGTYTLEFGHLVTLHCDQTLPTGSSQTQRISIDGDTMQMSDPDGTTFSFRKVK